MKKELLIVIFFSASLFAQTFRDKYNYKNTSLDVTINPASVAMGESFVANYFSPSSFLENPANLFLKNNTSLFYNTRSLNWIAGTESYKYTSIGGTLRFFFGDLAIAYNEFRTGNNYMFAGTSEERNSTLVFGLSKKILNNFNAGINVKFFNHKRNGTIEFNNQLESNTAVLFDFGLLYSLFNISEMKYSHQLTIGTSFQNFGTDYKEKDYFFGNDYQFVRLPKYFRIGLAYNLQFKNSDDRNDFEILVTSSYKSLLNPLLYEKGDVDYWGVGSQFRIKELFVARIGVFQTPEHLIYYDRAKMIFRYGFGINFPLSKLGLEIPLTISADYSFIPINQINLLYNSAGEQIKSNKSLFAAGISIRMNDLFITE